MNVGFVGLGPMGQAMARNLLKAGHRVFVYNRTRSRAEGLRDEGAEVADSPAAACKGDVVITMLADDDAVEEIVPAKRNRSTAAGRYSTQKTCRCRWRAYCAITSSPA
jgi:3-hydroxyisobutyrate dehydrogenase-like beta-hydroxyacid dehydrogenase